MKTPIVRSVFVAFAAAFLLTPLLHASDPSKMVGTWDLVAQTPDGDRASVLTITEAGGELEVQMSMQGVDRRVTDAKIEGDVFQMTVHVDGVAYDVEANVDGDTFEGTFSGIDASGTLKATRRP